MAQRQPAQTYLQAINAARRWRAVFREQRELALFAGSFIEDGDRRLYPDSVFELSKVNRGAIDFITFYSFRINE